MQLRPLLFEIAEAYEVFLDMDGVLVNFDGQMVDTFGKNFETMANELGSKEIWRQVEEQGADFWLGMRPLPGYNQLVSYIRDSGVPMFILTAPPKPKNVDVKYIQDVMKWKTQWIRRHVGGTKMLFAYSGEKGKYAKPNRILVDDWKENLSDWKSKGGIPIQHVNAVNTIKKLQAIGV
jgi:hypothetical protein